MVMQTKLDRDAALPLLIRTETGLEPSPYLGIMDRAGRTMARLASELGFSPAARARLRAAPDDDPNDDDPETVSPWDLLKVIRGGKSGAA
jgi:phage terminase small subunit